MNLDQIIKILEPLKGIVKDKILIRDYRKIPTNKKIDTDYYQLLWYESKFNTSIDIRVFDDGIRTSLIKDENKIIYRVFPNDITNLNIDKSTIYQLKYFIHGVKKHFEYMSDIMKFNELKIPKDFIREQRLSELLE